MGQAKHFKKPTSPVNGPLTDRERTANGPRTDRERTVDGPRTDRERTVDGPRTDRKRTDNDGSDLLLYFIFPSIVDFFVQFFDHF